MAKYDVTHSCGHTQEHDLFGPHKERESKIDWLAGTLCSDCYAAKLAEEREAASKLNHEWAKTEGLSPLCGSAKQISWAETLRASMLGDAQTTAQAIREHIALHPDGDKPEIKAAESALTDALTWLSQQDQARFWIDHREKRALDLLLGCPYVLPHLDVLIGHKAAEKYRAVDPETEKRAREAAAKQAVEDLRERHRQTLIQIMGEAVPLAVKTSAGAKRVYIGEYPSPLVFHATGDRYHADGELECKSGILAEIAARLGVTPDEAKTRVELFCIKLCDKWNTFRLY
mgnify:FL=1